MSAWARALLLLGCLVLPAAAAAQDRGQARCQVTGPLVISAYSAFLSEVVGQDRFAAARQAQNVASQITLYDALGCPVPALQDAIECLTAKLLTAGGAEPVTARDAETCMRDAGMPVR